MNYFEIEEVLPFIPSIKTMFNQPKCDRGVYLRFYNPIGPGDWIVMSAGKRGNDILFYGLIIMNTVRFDYFKFSELKNKKLPFDFKLETDFDLEIETLDEFLKTLKLAGYIVLDENPSHKRKFLASHE